MDMFFVAALFDFLYQMRLELSCSMFADCVAYLTDRTGSIASPIVPVGYHSQFDCSWTISGGKYPYIY